MATTETRGNYFDSVQSKGRPKLILNATGKALVESLAAIMCTDEEIASILGVSVDTLTRTSNAAAFADCKLKGQSRGKMSLRRAQFDLAKKNATMAIFLGKQYLNQREDVDTTEDREMEVVFNIRDMSGASEQ